MLNIEKNAPQAHQYLATGAFAGPLSGQKIYHDTHGPNGGLSGVNKKKGASERWMWINHFLTALKQNLGLQIQRGQLTQHVEFSTIRMKKDEDHVKRVVARLKLWVNDLWKKERPLVNICDGTIASDKMVQNVLSTRKTVEDAMTKYFTQFTTTGADVADSKISK